MDTFLPCACLSELCLATLVLLIVLYTRWYQCINSLLTCLFNNIYLWPTAALTKDVDLTITNILEGRVQFNPVAPSVNEPVTASPANTTMNSSERTTVSVIFLYQTHKSPKTFRKCSWYCLEHHKGWIWFESRWNVNHVYTVFNP